MGDPQVVLFQHGGRFLQAVFQELGGLQALVTAGPLALPMEGEGTQPHHRHTQAQQAAIGDPMEARQPRGGALNPACREGSLDQGQGALTRAPGAAGGGWGWGGNHGAEEQLFK